jgi:hypothetical protein
LLKLALNTIIQTLTTKMSLLYGKANYLIFLISIMEN